MVIKYPKCPSNIPNTSTFSNLRPTKIFPNSDFCFENKPSGNPGGEGSYVCFSAELCSKDRLAVFFANC
jgi:hypothetical protein